MTKKQKIGIVAFGLPIVLFLIIMAIMGQYPFGEDTLMILDMESQYHAFFVHFRDILHGEASPWYSFSRALGGDMVSVAAYYLISPFNLLFFFFDAENIYAGIALVMLLKIGTIGWTMNVYLCKKRESYATLLFSTAFALSGYIVAYGSNIIWLDGILILPIMVLGIERLVDEGKYLTYLLSIAFGVITSFYIGYMLCLFSVLYFLCYYFLLSETKKKGLTFLVYGGSSLLGGALSAVVAIPTIYAMQDGKAKMDASVLTDWTINAGYKRLGLNSFVGTIDDLQMVTGSPLIYAGVLTILLAACFFILKEPSRKEKLGYALLLGVLVFSIRHYNLCYIWQGFNVPNGAFYRFSFLYIFVILVVANAGWNAFFAGGMERWKKGALGASGAFWLLVLFLEMPDFRLMGHTGMWGVNLALLVGNVLLLYLLWEKKWRSTALLMLMCTELCVGAVCHFRYSVLHQSSVRTSDYDAYMEQTVPLVEKVKAEEGMFRTVLAGEAYRTPSDNFLFNLYGLDSYTSLEQSSTQQAAFQFGYYTHMVLGIHYREGTTHAAESLLGVKYLISDQKPPAGYRIKDEQENLVLYENEAALPIALLADESLIHITNEDYNPFRYQNEIFQSLSKQEKEPIFTRVQLDVKDMENCTRNADGTFLVEDERKEAYVEFSFAVEKEGMYYLESITSDASDALVWVNGDIYAIADSENIVKRLGYFMPEDQGTLRFYIEGESPKSLEGIYVYHEDEALLQKYVREIRSNEVTITKETDSRLTVGCTNGTRERRYLLLTIPLDAGWHAQIDGEEVPLLNVLHNLTAISLEPGTYEIELSYIPRGLKKGAAITGAAAVLCIAASLLCRQRRKTKEHEGHAERKTV
ncbi:MAG: YfhO family protein [Clostridiales bacterium]|nr:YfhO family protein [Clostridiales bacterium]